MYAAGDYELPLAGSNLPRPNKYELKRTLSTRSVGPQVSCAGTRNESSCARSVDKKFLSISLIRYNIKHQQDRWDNQQHQEDFLCMKSNPVIFKFPA